MKYNSGEKCAIGGLYACSKCSQEIIIKEGISFPTCSNCSQSLCWILVYAIHKKENCWEFMKCPKEIHLHCPAFTNKTLNTVHGGKNCGRACWVVKQTICKENFDQSSFLRKLNNCKKCPFFQKVYREENKDFKNPIILNRLFEQLNGHI